MAIGKKVWLNGKIVPEENTRISLFAHTLHYGVGAFEGIRAYRQKSGGGGIFRLKEHLERLLASVKILGLTTPFTLDQLVDGCIEACRSNDFEECYLRPIVYIGDGPLGLGLGKNPPVHVAILTWEWGRYLGEEGIRNGIRVKTSSFIRPHLNSVMTKGKINGQYVTGVLARKEAVADGFDEAIFLDPWGNVAEGSGENIFMVRKGVVKTPPLSSILEGITRETVIEILKHRGVEIQETLFSKDELWSADEVFLTGTAAEITPVVEMDRRTLGTGKPGPITLKIQKDYQNIVQGDLPSYAKDWITTI